MSDTQVTVHRVQARLFPVNAYLVETPTAIVAVDATLGMSDGAALRARIDATGKPLAGVLVTHSHPDHYGGITALLDGTTVPVYALDGVSRVIRRDDDEKERILRPMFGDEWAKTRTFPTHTVADSQPVTVGGVTFRAVDVGPGESPHDSWWLLESDGPPRAFVGDLFYNHMHAYLADGFSDRWLDNLRRAKRELPPDIELFVGHGEPAQGLDVLDWQIGYIDTFHRALRSAAVNDGLRGDALADAVAREVKSYLSVDDLEFLLRLSIEPCRARLTDAD